MKNKALTLKEGQEKAAQIIASGNETSLPIVTIGGVRYYVKSKLIYATKFLADLVNGEFLKAADQEIPGIRNIKGNQIPLGTFLTVNEVKILTGVAATQDDAGLIGCAFATNAEPIVKNSDFEINQNGVPLYTGTVEDLNNWKASTSNQEDYTVVSDFIVRGGVGFNFKTTLASTAYTAKTALKVIVKAVEYTPVGR